MTPDVSSVTRLAEGAVWGEWCETYGDEDGDHEECKEDEPCFVWQQKVQQAAEQACYRYALDRCERVLSDADNARLDGGQVAYERVMEEQVEVLRQLIAGSA